MKNLPTEINKKEDDIMLGWHEASVQTDERGYPTEVTTPHYASYVLDKGSVVKKGKSSYIAKSVEGWVVELKRDRSGWMVRLTPPNKDLIARVLSVKYLH